MHIAQDLEQGGKRVGLVRSRKHGAMADVRHARHARGDIFLAAFWKLRVQILQAECIGKAPTNCQ